MQDSDSVHMRGSDIVDVCKSCGAVLDNGRGSGSTPSRPVADRGDEDGPRDFRGQRLSGADDSEREARERRQRKRRIWRASLSAAVVLTLLPFGLPVCHMSCASCEGYRHPALDAIDRCPAAAAALGTPAHFSYVGLACNGNCEDHCNGSAWVGGSFAPVVGPSGRGTYQFSADESDGHWTVSSAKLTIGDRTITVVPCEGETDSQ